MTRGAGSPGGAEKGLHDPAPSNCLFPVAVLGLGALDPAKIKLWFFSRQLLPAPELGLMRYLDAMPGSNSSQSHLAGTSLASQPVNKPEWSLCIQPDPSLNILLPRSGKTSWSAGKPCSFIIPSLLSAMCQVPFLRTHR